MSRPDGDGGKEISMKRHEEKNLERSRNQKGTHPLQGETRQRNYKSFLFFNNVLQSPAF